MKCPGQDSQHWKSGAVFEVKCPKCGTEVEFFKDDPSRKCGNCGHRFLNPDLDFGCASYCQYAEQCIGNLPPELLKDKEDLLKDRVAIEMKRYFQTGFQKNRPRKPCCAICGTDRPGGGGESGGYPYRCLSP